MIRRSEEGPFRGSALVDARGKSVSMIDPINQSMVRRSSEIDGASLDRMAEEITPGARRRLCLVTLILGSAALVTLGLMALNSRTAGTLNWTELADNLADPAYFSIGAYLMFVLPWTILAEKRKRKHKTFAVLLKHRRCPHCGYSLQGLAVDPVDGATVCPECACAWKLDDPLIERMCAGSCGCALRNSRHRVMIIVLALLLAVLLGLGVMLYYGIT